MHTQRQFSLTYSKFYIMLLQVIVANGLETLLFLKFSDCTTLGGFVRL